MKLGERLPNGSYNGLIGAAAERRGDIIMQFVNPGSFDVDLDVPGSFGPIAFDAELSILSAGQPADKSETTLLSVIAVSVEPNVSLYLFIWTIMFMIIHTVIVFILWKGHIRDKRHLRREYRHKTMQQSRRSSQPEVTGGTAIVDVDKIGGKKRKNSHRKKKPSNACAVIMTVTNCIWLIIEVLLLTESSVKTKLMIRKTFSLAILTFSLIISVYYVFDLVLWNCLSADLAVNLPAKYIDHILDLVNATSPTGSKVIPVILTDFGALSYLKSSTNEDERALFNYIQSFPGNVSKVTFNDYKDMHTLFQLIEAVSNGQVALIERAFTYTFVPLLCYCRPEDMKRLHVMEEPFGFGYFTFFYGPAMAPPSVSDMNFHITNLREMGFLFEGLKHQGTRDMLIEPDAFTRSLVPSVIAGLKCEDEVVEKVARDPRYDPQQVKTFDLVILREPFLIFIYGMCTSFGVILYEIGIRSLELSLVI